MSIIFRRRRVVRDLIDWSFWPKVSLSWGPKMWAIVRMYILLSIEDYVWRWRYWKLRDIRVVMLRIARLSLKWWVRTIRIPLSTP